MTLEESFELTVIFFGLTNSLVIFQIVINEILWNLINTREVAIFINNIIIRMEEEKRHNKIVKEIVKQLAENKWGTKSRKSKTSKR